MSDPQPQDPGQILGSIEDDVFHFSYGLEKTVYGFAGDDHLLASRISDNPYVDFAPYSPFSGTSFLGGLGKDLVGLSWSIVREDLSVTDLSQLLEGLHFDGGPGLDRVWIHLWTHGLRSMQLDLDMNDLREATVSSVEIHYLSIDVITEGFRPYDYGDQTTASVTVKGAPGSDTLDIDFLMPDAIDSPNPVVDLRMGGGADSVSLSAPFRHQFKVEGNVQLGPGGDHVQTEVSGLVLRGGLGADILDSFAGETTLIGGPGDDYLQLDAFEEQVFDTEGSLLRGGYGDDRLTGNLGNADLYGGPGNDKLEGTGDHQSFFGGSGDDRVQARGKNLEVRGGPGQDTLSVTLHAPKDAEMRGEIRGGSGDDTLIILVGAYGALADVEGTVVLRGGPGNDSLFISPIGGFGPSISPRGSGAEVTMIGGPGADTFHFGAAKSFQNRVMDFQSGIDSLYLDYKSSQDDVAFGNGITSHPTSDYVVNTASGQVFFRGDLFVDLMGAAIEPADILFNLA